jgi:hypothetical protein
MEILSQFLLRLAFGLTVGMAITSPRKVSSGFFRNHLYVALGLATLASLASTEASAPAAWWAGCAAVLSFVGAACWLYEARRAGGVVLWLVAASAYAAALASDSAETLIGGLSIWRAVALAASGLVLGLTLAAMLLGHWYLNSPGMELAPLRRLVAAAAMAVGIQMVVSGVGLAAGLPAGAAASTDWLSLVLLRWSFGLCGMLALLWMAWRTLDIPNTQSATGILYVAVIAAFVGELAAVLLSADSRFPL